MKHCLMALVFAFLLGPLLVVETATSADATSGILDRAASKRGESEPAARVAAANPDSIRIGGVDRTRANVEGALGRLRRDLQRDLPVFQNEEVTTGANARAVLRFRDGSVLAIGADAEVVLDEFVYGNSGGVITLLKGTMRFTSGKLGRPGLKIKMPMATIGIRGTDFWAGQIDGGFGVLLLHGVVDVSNEAGSVTLSKRSQGTLISASDVAPSEPEIWNGGRQDRALAAVSFPRGPLCTMLQKVARDMFRSCI